MEESLRIRLVFDDPMILSKSQRSRGLNQSWLLLNSTIATIADLASHVCRIFKLQRCCHDSLLLSMDDFVLPPFESTCILKDKDIIRVRKKDGTRMEATELDANAHNIQYSGVQENGHTISSDKILAIREFGDDSGQCKRNEAKELCAHNETANHTGSPLKPKNKRKHSDEIRGSKVRKKDGSRMDAIELDANPHNIQYSGVKENGHAISSDKILAIREFGDDSGQCKRKKAKELCAHNETANHTGSPLEPKNKRKHSDEIRGSKAMGRSFGGFLFPKRLVFLETNISKKFMRKKKLKASSKKPNVSNDEDVDTAEEPVRLRNSLDSSEKKSCSLKSSNKKDKPSTSNERPGPLVNSQWENSFDLATSSFAKREKSSGQKNLQLVSRENAIISTSIAGDKPAEQNQGSFLKTDSSAKRLCKNDRQSDKDGKSDAVFASHPDDCKQPNSVLMEERSVQVEDNIGGNACKPHGNDGGTKVQSRSARRKKAKRQWLKEIKSQQAQNTRIQTPPDINHREKPEQQKTRQYTEMEKEIVPLVIRPGHIRFEPLDEEQGQWQSQTHETMETLQWKGTTSKKRGQMWGQEKGGSRWNEANGYEVQYNRKENGGNGNNANSYKKQCNRKEKAGKWNDARGYKEKYNENEKTVSEWNGQSNGQNFGNNANCHNEQSNGKLKIMNNVNDLICHDEQSNGKEKSTSKWNDANGCEKQCNTKANECIDANGSQSNRKAISEEGKTGSGPIDFDSLFPLTRIPQVGDVLAYRLIELSSSWCPEVSSFRVGKVTSYDNLSMIIVLVPVPEYPIFTDEDIEGGDSILEANSSQYNEDGSLQIHYPSLVDVRLFKASDLEATTSEREMIPQDAAAENNCEPAAIDSNTNYTVTQPTENEKVGICGWDEIRQALNEKKEELLKKGGQKESTPSNSSAGAARSYRGLRRNALGPTLAFLRENNDGASL